MSEMENIVGNVVDGEGIMSVIKPEIITVREMLSDKQISIPDYQRPYKWTIKNVNQLIDDILHFKNQTAYRLGTIVYHEKDDKLDIVDGQQRSVTLALITLAISTNTELQGIAKKNKFKFPDNAAIKNFVFNHSISKENLRSNYREIERRIVDFDYDTLVFLFDNCEVVKVVLKDISEAFQFFDSQNARGKDLDPHDLLKAFHLREINPNTDENRIKEIVAEWENLETKQIVSTFSEYLFRIRFWSKGKSARHFDKSHVDEFKGISPSVSEPYPYATMYRIAHFYLKGYNADYNRLVDKNSMTFPFQLDQVVINGERFFEMIQHYIKIIQPSKSKESLLRLINNDSVAKKIIETINEYDARKRTGDMYVRNLFDTALVYYIDKFGYVELERAIEKIFIWSYQLRLKRQSVQLASMDNHALVDPLIFKTLREALNPSEFLNIPINLINESDFEKSNESRKLDEIVSLFKELNYIQ